MYNIKVLNIYSFRTIPSKIVMLSRFVVLFRLANLKRITILQ